MKSFLPLFLLFFLFTTQTSYAQNWVKPGSVWTYGYFGMSEAGYRVISYEKDTLINSQASVKLSSTLFVHSYGGGPVYTISNYYPIFTFSRKDTVFFFNNGIFQPSYFFNAKPGDTVRGYASNCLGDSLLEELIDTVDKVIINNRELKYYTARVLNIDTTWYPYRLKVIEGLGAINNFMIPVIACVDGDEYSLRCYSDDSFPIYHTDTSVACDYIINEINREPLPEEIKIYPNPVSGTLHVTVPVHSLINIYNVLGQKLINYVADKPDANIDVSKLPAGIYFIKALVKGNAIENEFIKTD